jgi:hypothetical protein
MLGWLPLTKRATDARRSNEVGRCLMNAAILGATLRHDAESGLAFGGEDARDSRTSMSAPPNSATIDRKQTLTPRMRRGDCLWQGSCCTIAVSSLLPKTKL